MPYRRLPNTDKSRIRAMKRALEKGKELPPHKLAFSPKTTMQLERFLPLFERNIQSYRETLTVQTRKNKFYFDTLKKARLYLTHFIRVMNMAIFRGELPAETRAFYGLATNESTVPSLKTENELMTWGRRVIEGEEFRIRKGGSPITNPTIAVVKVRFGNFLDTLDHHNTISKQALGYNEKITALRKEADGIILSVWNDVERTFHTLSEDLRKSMCETYGLVYFYRKNEKNNLNIPSPQDQPQQ
jgi:hypothetical protein